MLDEAPGALIAPVVPPAELAAPAPVPLAAPAPVPLAELEASAPGAGEGVGVVVVVDDEEEEESAGALEAGGGVVTVCSSFLQAVRPTATRAAIRSERVIFLVL